MTYEAPRVYIACLAAYNAGILHGAWVTVAKDAEDIEAAIAQIIESSPVPDAEEWAIHDFENWEGIQVGEYESLDRLVELAESLAEHGKAFALYYEYFGNDATAEDFKEHYLGIYESEKDFVYEMWEQDGRLKELEKLGISESYIDWEVIARDWFIDSYLSLSVSHSQVYVFNRY